MKFWLLDLVPKVMLLVTFLESTLSEPVAAAAAAKLLQSCPTLCNTMDCSPPGSSVHEISRARILECKKTLMQGKIEGRRRRG